MTSKDKKNIERLFYEERFSYVDIGRLYPDPANSFKPLTRQRIHQIITGYDSHQVQEDLSFTNTYVKNNECVKCQSPEATDMHHLDGNNANNKPRNLVALCRDCHKGLHPKETKVTMID